jgi:hypothetical protein
VEGAINSELPESAVELDALTDDEKYSSRYVAATPLVFASTHFSRYHSPTVSFSENFGLDLGASWAAAP